MSDANAALFPSGPWTGFHIWPEGMADPTVQRLAEGADVPADPPKQRKRKAQPVG